MHLAEYMALHSLDDDAVASKIHRSRATVSRIRRRKVRPDWSTIEELKAFTNGESTADDYVNLGADQ